MVSLELQLLQYNDILQAYQFITLGNFQGPKGLQISPSLLQYNTLQRPLEISNGQAGASAIAKQRYPSSIPVYHPWKFPRFSEAYYIVSQCEGKLSDVTMGNSIHSLNKYWNCFLAHDRITSYIANKCLPSKAYQRNTLGNFRGPIVFDNTIPS